jgi:hypothetical protein
VPTASPRARPTPMPTQRRAHGLTEHRPRDRAGSAGGGDQSVQASASLPYWHELAAFCWSAVAETMLPSGQVTSIEPSWNRQYSIDAPSLVRV